MDPVSLEVEFTIVEAYQAGYVLNREELDGIISRVLGDSFSQNWSCTGRWNKTSRNEIDCRGQMEIWAGFLLQEQKRFRRVWQHENQDLEVRIGDYKFLTLSRVSSSRVRDWFSQFLSPVHWVIPNYPQILCSMLNKCFNKSLSPSPTPEHL